MPSENSTQELHIVYGTGPLGCAITRALIKRGHRVHMVNRSGRRPENISDAIQVVASDAYDSAKVRTTVEGATAVYQAAQPGYTEWPEKFPPLQTAILNGVADAGAKLIVGENLYMYGAVDGLIHEELPYNAHTRKGRVRAQMARQLIDAHEKGRVQVAMARGSDFYGPGVLGSMLGERVFKPLVQGKAASLIGNPDLPHSQTYIDDFGEAMAILGERDAALGAIWHVPDAPTKTTREVLQMAADYAGVPLKVQVAPKLILRLMGLFVPDIREVNEMLYEFEAPFVVDHSKFVQAFGDIHTPYAESIPATVDWYRAHI